MKCIECDAPKVTYRCHKCGGYYCLSCAKLFEGLCECIPRTIVSLKRYREIKEASGAKA